MSIAEYHSVVSSTLTLAEKQQLAISNLLCSARMFDICPVTFAILGFFTAFPEKTLVDVERLLRDHHVPCFLTGRCFSVPNLRFRSLGSGPSPAAFELWIICRPEQYAREELIKIHGPVFSKEMNDFLLLRSGVPELLSPSLLEDDRLVNEMCRLSGDSAEFRPLETLSMKIDRVLDDCHPLEIWTRKCERWLHEKQVNGDMYSCARRSASCFGDSLPTDSAYSMLVIPLTKNNSDTHVSSYCLVLLDHAGFAVHSLGLFCLEGKYHVRKVYVRCRRTDGRLVIDLQ